MTHYREFQDSHRLDWIGLDSHSEGSFAQVGQFLVQRGFQEAGRMRPAGLRALLSSGELVLLAQVRLPSDSQISFNSLLYHARE